MESGKSGIEGLFSPVDVLDYSNFTESNLYECLNLRANLEKIEDPYSMLDELVLFEDSLGTLNEDFQASLEGRQFD